MAVGCIGAQSAGFRAAGPRSGAGRTTLFATLVIQMVEIGFIAPPVGLNVCVVSGIRADIPINGIFRAIRPFVASDILTVALLILFPSITLFLPTLMLGTG